MVNWHLACDQNSRWSAGDKAGGEGFCILDFLFLRI
jgi:hypothetical protein